MKRTLAIGVWQLCTAATLLGQMAGMSTRTPDPAAKIPVTKPSNVTFTKDVAPDRAAALPKLPSSGRGHTVFHDDVRRSAALGCDDEADGGYTGDAALV